MPCNSDYMNPTTFESECRRIANLILFVDSHFKGITPKWIKQCAKNQWGSENGGAGGDKRLAPYLCGLIKSLNNPDLNLIVYNAKKKQSRDLADWWEAHQEADADRERREREVRDKKKLQAAALGKLSEAEIAALGVGHLTLGIKKKK